MRLIIGHTFAKIKLYAVDGSECQQVELLVDTGSTYTWVPASLLEKISIKPSTVRNFRTIDGRTLKREVGEVLMEYMNERATRMVVFAEKGDANILGVDALEGLGLEADPVSKELRKAEALLGLQSVASESLRVGGGGKQESFSTVECKGWRALNRRLRSRVRGRLPSFRS